MQVITNDNDSIKRPLKKLFITELINGKLDQKNRQLEIDYAVARDIQTESLQEIVTILTDWLKSCESCSSCLQEQIEFANAEKGRRIKHKDHLQEQVNLNPTKAMKESVSKLFIFSSPKSKRTLRSNHRRSSRTLMIKMASSSWDQRRIST
jgi:COP9 signalosome complex subunit 7a helix I domain